MTVAEHRIHEVTGTGLGPWLDGLGELRIRVFREYPYLYDGSLEYERAYLMTYQESRGALVVLVTDAADKVVAATTCVPLSGAGAEFREPFDRAGIDVSKVLYLGESLALPEWRGKGFGKLFFDLREAHAERLGLEMTAFCAVDRASDHPLRPAGYRPLDGFWESRGYERRPDLRAVLHWKETGERDDTPKDLTFWLRSWTR